MNDNDLKNLLQETCPVLPGQENRAWSLLNERLQKRAGGSFSWLTWRSALGYGAGIAALAVAAVYLSTPGIEPVSASSQAPGVFATAFYSQGAHAQVVWLNGVGPAADGPTYMDRTGQVDERASAAKSSDSL
jgi:hypothetical protein